MRRLLLLLILVTVLLPVSAQAYPYMCTPSADYLDLAEEAVWNKQETLAIMWTNCVMYESESTEELYNAYRLRSILHEYQGKYLVAAYDHTQLLKLVPNDRYAMQQRGYVYMLAGDYEQAIENFLAFEQAYGFDSWNVSSIAYSYLKLGNTTQARAYYEKAYGEVGWLDAIYLQYVYEQLGSPADLQATTTQTWLGNFSVEDRAIQPGERLPIEMGRGMTYRMRFQGTANQTVTITAFDTGERMVGTLVLLLDPGGRLLAFNNDSAIGWHAQIKDVVLPADGIYTLYASHAGIEQRGKMEVLIESAN